MYSRSSPIARTLYGRMALDRFRLMAHNRISTADLFKGVGQAGGAIRSEKPRGVNFELHRRVLEACRRDPSYRRLFADRIVNVDRVHG